MITIYRNYWLEIFKDDERYVIRYNSGDHFDSIREIEVTEEDAMRAQEGDEAAYWVITHYKNVEQFGEEEMNRWYAARGGRPMYDPIPR